MKITSSGWYYVTFKSIFVFWDILEHELQKALKFLLGLIYISSGGYHISFKSIFVFWDILQNDLKNGWNFCLVWKLHQADDIM